MSDTSTQLKFDCPSCGRQFAWRPEIAGKRAKCKCGGTVKVPADPPSAPEPAEQEYDDAGYGIAEEAGAAGLRCPSCGQSLAPGAVLCVGCGFNLKTGQKMGTAMMADDDEAVPVAAAKPTRAPATVAATPSAGGGASDLASRFGVPPGLRTPVFKEEKPQLSSYIKPALIFLVLAAVAGGAIVGFRALSGGGDDAAMHEIDREIKRMTGDAGAFELKAWLADNKRQQRMVMGMNEAQAAGFADKLYDRGAVKVFAFGHMMTLQLGVELPEDPDKRKELFQFQADWHSSMAIPPQKDEGQKHMLLHMKLVR